MKDSTNFIIHAPISIGELVDKITILEIKKSIFKGEKLENVICELNNLKKILDKYPFEIEHYFFNKLRNVNKNLWEIEDLIRIKETEKNFDNSFIELARSVYKQNDKRFLIKQEINAKYKSSIIEEKGYSFEN